MHHRLTRALALCLTMAALPAMPAVAAPSFQIAAAASADRYLIQSKAERKAFKFNAALATLEQALRVAPNDFEARMALGKLNNLRGEHEKALEQFTKCLTLKEDDFAAQVMVARCYVLLENYDKSRELCEKLESHPDRKDAPAWYRSELYGTLGGSLGLKSKREGLLAMLQYGLRVRKEIEKAVEIDPENARAQYSLGRYFLEAPGAVGGDSKHGTSLLLKASKMDPEDYLIRGAYVRGLYQTNSPEAKEEAERFVKDFAELAQAREDFPDIVARVK